MENVNELLDRCTKAAFEELARQLEGRPDDLSDAHGKPPFTVVLAYDGFNLREMIREALSALPWEAMR